MQSFFCRIFSLFGVTIHASKDRNGSSWVREPPNLLLSVFGRTGPAEKVPRAGGLQDRTEGSCNPSKQFSLLFFILKLICYDVLGKVQAIFSRKKQDDEQALSENQ